jgi:hypothetical protein
VHRYLDVYVLRCIDACVWMGSSRIPLFPCPVQYRRNLENNKTSVLSFPGSQVKKRFQVPRFPLFTDSLLNGY